MRVAARREPERLPARVREVEAIYRGMRALGHGDPLAAEMG